MTTIIIPTLNMSRAKETSAAAIRNSGVDGVGSVIVHDNRERGWTYAINYALSTIPCGSEDVCFLNDDCRLNENWLSDMLTTLNSYPKFMQIGFVGPSGRCRTHPQNTGRRGDNRSAQLVHHLSGFCLLVSKEVVSCQPQLDPGFSHYGSDVAYQIEAAKLGFRSVWLPKVYCEHELHEPVKKWLAEDQKRLYSLYSEYLPFGGVNNYGTS